MYGLFVRFVAVSLTVCLLLLGGLASAQAVEHAGHHAHHQAATHATFLCTWMCAAGQALETAAVLAQPKFVPLAFADLAGAHEPSSSILSDASTRGPPSSSL